jgi:hypothetical protein
MRILVCALGIFVVSQFANREIFAENVVVTTTTIVSAEESCQRMARTGVLRHCGRAGGRREGIGFSTTSAESARRACCFFGRYRIVEEAVVWSPIRRGWFAVIRYAD